MALNRDPRNLRKLKAIRRAEFSLKQRLERIDWEEDELLPEVMEFEGKAKLPELPSETIIEVIYEKPEREPKPRAARNGK